MKQNKKPKQTLESAQYELEINFKSARTDDASFSNVRALAVPWMPEVFSLASGKER